MPVVIVINSIDVTWELVAPKWIYIYSQEEEEEDIKNRFYRGTNRLYDKDNLQ